MACVMKNDNAGQFPFDHCRSRLLADSQQAVMEFGSNARGRRGPRSDEGLFGSLRTFFLLTGRSHRPNISVTDVLMTKAPALQDLLPLTPPVFHILLALTDEERHGYGIMQDVALQTRDALQLGPGTLYGCLKRMLAAGLVEESDERPDLELDDERRRYYRMTALGQRVVRAEAQRLRNAVIAAKAKRVLSSRKALIAAGIL
jgi:DNA-binding PadR family transcriptional regulator